MGQLGGGFEHYSISRFVVAAAEPTAHGGINQVIGILVVAVRSTIEGGRLLDSEYYRKLSKGTTDPHN